MDKFDNVVRKNIYELKNSNSRLPGKVDNKSINQGKNYYILDLSYDNFNKFINDTNNKIDLPFNINIYDESIIENNEDLKLRINLLNKLNQLNINSINFYFSDSTLYYYNLLMNEIGWKHSDTTSIHLSLDRHPVGKKPNDLNLEIAKGKININEEKLLWLSDNTLIKLQSKVEDRIIKDAYNLKDVAKEFYKYVDNNYDVSKLSDYGKLLIAYEYVKNVLNINFASRYTTTVNGKQELINPHPSYISEPFGTYKNKEGVCEGQARLISVLLNNHFMKMDATTIGGKCNLGNHAWVGAVIDNKLFECCPTMKGPFRDLTRNGYIPNDEEIYSKIYRRSYLTDGQINQVRNHIKQLKKEGR